MPAVGRDDDPLGRHVRQRPADALGDRLGRLDVMSLRSMTPRMIVLPGSVARTEVSRFDCAVSIEICFTGESASSGRNE